MLPLIYSGSGINLVNQENCGKVRLPFRQTMDLCIELTLLDPQKAQYRLDCHFRFNLKLDKCPLDIIPAGSLATLLLIHYLYQSLCKYCHLTGIKPLSQRSASKFLHNTATDPLNNPANPSFKYCIRSIRGGYCDGQPQ